MRRSYRQLLIVFAIPFALAVAGCGGSFDRNRQVEVTTDEASYPNDVPIFAFITNWTHCTVTLSQCMRLVKLSDTGEPEWVVDTVCSPGEQPLETGGVKDGVFEPWEHPPGRYAVYVGVTGCAATSPASSAPIEIR